MRKTLQLYCVFILSVLCFLSCSKNLASEDYTETENNVKADLTSRIITNVSGFITDKNNTPVSGAMVTAGSKTAITNEYGFFTIKDASLLKTCGFIKITKPGYFDGFRTFIGKPGKETTIRLQLISKANTGAINALSGGNVTTTDGAIITIPANGVVTSNYTAYTGSVNVAAHWINPTTVNEMQLTMPGDLRGVDSAGYLKRLASFGMMAVELTGEAGQKLQIVTDKKATLSFPIPSTLSSSAPASIPLWYFNENTGLWKQESFAIKNGNNYVGEVSHFSYWNCDMPLNVVNFTAQIIDENLKPFANVPVSIINTGQYSSPVTYFTDSAGYVYGSAPANENITLNVLGIPCYTSIYSKLFRTGNTDIDLGTIQITNADQNSFLINGSVVNCNNQPANGFVYFYNNNVLINSTPIINGNFSINTIYCSREFKIIAADTSTGMVSTPLSTTLSTDSNNLGVLQACTSVPQDEYIRFSVDGGTEFNSTNLQGSTSLFNNGSSYETWINYYDSSSIVYGLAFNFSSTAVTPGTYTASSSDYLVEGPPGKYTTNNQYYFSEFQVLIAEYGAIGGYISGSFTCNAVEDNLQGSDVHVITCSFRVKRTN